MPIAKIYMIVNDVDLQVYVGSTKQELSKRMTDHRRMSETGVSNMYKHMRLLGVDKFHIILREAFGWISHEDMLAAEHHWIEQIGSTGSYGMFKTVSTNSRAIVPNPITRAFRSDLNVLGFLSEFLVDDNYLNQTEVKSTVLYGMYEEWCVENNAHKFNRAKFGKMIRLPRKRKNFGYVFILPSL
jgi:hypothetical protein